MRSNLGRRVSTKSSRPEGDKAEIYRKLKGIAEKYGDAIRKGFPKIKRRVSGYNLDQLLPENGFNVARALVGSEGTCALTLQAEVRLVKSPPERVLVVLGFPDIYAAGDAVPRILAAKPIACEGLDEAIIGGLRERRLRLDDIALLPPGKAWLMVEFGGDTREEAVLRAAALGGGVITDKAMIARLWTIRETGASATSLNLGGKGIDPGGRLGGRGGRPAAPRRLPARVPGAGRPLRLPHLLLRAFRRRLHPRAHRLRPAHRRRPRALAQIPRPRPRAWW